MLGMADLGADDDLEAGNQQGRDNLVGELLVEQIHDDLNQMIYSSATEASAAEEVNE